MFAGVFGGNCLDDEHAAKLLNAFEEVPQSDKAGCAFFFKEHVIAVLRVGKEYHFVDSLGGGDASGMGTRTVCADVEALRVFLRYYVSKKLPPGCVGNAFDEATADFDARLPGLLAAARAAAGLACVRCSTHRRRDGSQGRTRRGGLVRTGHGSQGQFLRNKGRHGFTGDTSASGSSRPAASGTRRGPGPPRGSASCRPTASRWARGRTSGPWLAA